MSQFGSKWQDAWVALIWLTLRVRLRRAGTRSLAVVVLIGGVGGFILAAAASARTVEGSYRELLREIDAPDLVVTGDCYSIFGCDPAPAGGLDQVVVDLEATPGIEQARIVEVVTPFFVTANGEPLFDEDDNPSDCTTREQDGNLFMASLTAGDPVDQAVPFRLDGAMPATGSAEAVMALATSRRAGVDIGDSVRLAGWCNDDGSPRELDEPIDLVVTGLLVGPLDVKAPATGFTAESVYVNGFVVDALVAAGADLVAHAMVWLDPDWVPIDVNRPFDRFEIELDLRTKATGINEAVDTDARLLWLLAVVGVIGAVLLLAPVVARTARYSAIDAPTFIALGSTRQQVAADYIAYVGVLAIAGTTLALVLAPAIALLMPRGFAVAITPEPSVRLDWLVSIVGSLVLVVGMLAMAIAPAWRAARNYRSPTRAQRRLSGGLGFVRFHPATQAGVSAAVSRRTGTQTSSSWPARASLVIAAATCVAAVTFSAGLAHFKKTPALVGWSWDAQLFFEEASTRSVPEIIEDINKIEGVDVLTTGTPLWLTQLVVPETGLTVVPLSFDTGVGAITPTVLSGRAPAGPNEVAIDILFAEVSGLRVGDRVSLGRPRALAALADEALGAREALAGYELEETGKVPLVVDTFDITGVVVSPAERSQPIPVVAFTLDGITELVDADESEVAEALDWLPDGLPEGVQVQLEQFVSRVASVSIVLAYVDISGDPVVTVDEISNVDGVDEVFAPTAASILKLQMGLNLTSVDHIPGALANVLGFAAAALLLYVLITSVRARRKEFAVLRVLGMSGASVRWSVAVQATVTTVLPLIVALPLGVAIGRRAWLSYARDLDVLPVSVTPWTLLSIAVLACLVVANLAVLVPARMAARRRVGRDLRVG